MGRPTLTGGEEGLTIGAGAGAEGRMTGAERPKSGVGAGRETSGVGRLNCGIAVEGM